MNDMKQSDLVRVTTNVCTPSGAFFSLNQIATASEARKHGLERRYTQPVAEGQARGPQLLAQDRMMRNGGPDAPPSATVTPNNSLRTMNADEAIETIGSLRDAQVLAAMKVGEEQGLKRVTVLRAIEQRLAEIE